MFGLVIAFITLITFNNKVKAYNEYNIGDKVTYKGQEYYVIRKSYKTEDYVTLLKSQPLTVDELNKYGVDENGNIFINYSQYNYSTYNYEFISGALESDTGVGLVTYYTSDTCKNYDGVGCNPNYGSSNIKKILDNLEKEYDEDLVEKDGYKARLLTQDELVYQLGFSKNYGGSTYGFEADEDLHSWISSEDYRYWTMDVSEYNNNFVMVVIKNYVTFNSTNSNSAVRPVLNVKKCSLDEQDNGCLKCNYEASYEKVTVLKEYKVGDEVEYNGEKYYVIENSDKGTDYVTLLKGNPLTLEEILMYKGDLDIQINPYDQEGYVSYYSSDTCNYDNISGCTTDYNQSNVKVIVDNWASNFEEDLVSVNGYKARLLTIDNLLENLGYDINIKPTSNSFGLTEDVPEWVYNVSNAIWTMSASEDTQNEVYIILSYGKVISHEVFYSQRTIRPVINLNKCVLDGGCTEGQVANGCIDKDDNDEQDLTDNMVGNANQIVENPPTIDSIVKYIILFVVSLSVLITLIIFLKKTKLKKAK